MRDANLVVLKDRKSTTKSPYESLAKEIRQRKLREIIRIAHHDKKKSNYIKFDSMKIVGKKINDAIKISYLKPPNKDIIDSEIGNI